MLNPFLILSLKKQSVTTSLRKYTVTKGHSKRKVLQLKGIVSDEVN
jgi:hypothetical protein